MGMSPGSMYSRGMAAWLCGPQRFGRGCTREQIVQPSDYDLTTTIYETQSHAKRTSKSVGCSIGMTRLTTKCIPASHLEQTGDAPSSDALVVSEYVPIVAASLLA